MQLPYSIALALLGISALILPGCAHEHRASTTPSPASTDPTRTGRGMALIGELTISNSMLEPALIEAAGGVVLEEAVLDIALAQELARRALMVTAADIEREHTMLRESLASEANADQGQALQLLDNVRTRRGLGPHRFEALLARNAALRMLVHESVAITPEQEALEIAIATQPRVRARFFLHEHHATVRAARDQVLQSATTADRARVFAEVAASQSQDQSAPRGGLLAPLSLSDPSVPRSLRQALAAIREGDVSDVLAVPGGFAVLLHVGSAPAEHADNPEERARVLARLRNRLERLAMDAQAQQLISKARVTVLDPSLTWSWERRAR